MQQVFYTRVEVKDGSISLVSLCATFTSVQMFFSCIIFSQNGLNRALRKGEGEVNDEPPKMRNWVHGSVRASVCTTGFADAK